MRVKVTGAPGYADFYGETSPGYHRIRVASDQPLRSVVMDDDGQAIVVASQYVEEVDA